MRTVPLLLLLLLAAACGPDDEAPVETGEPAPQGVDGDADGVTVDDDCDDANPNISPAVPEACDGLDTDCNPGTGEEGLATVGFTTSSDLQAVLDAASVGDEVSVCAGLWQGPFEARVAVTLRGVAGAEATVVQGAATGPALTVTGGEVGGFTLTSGLRGIEVSDGAEVLLTGLVVSAFDAGTGNGAGIAIGSGAIVTLDASTITGNTAGSGGGIEVGPDATLTMTESLVDGNTALGAGGGLLVHPGATISGGTITQNDAVTGGGLALLGGATLSQMGVTFNNATLAGGGVHSTGTGSVTLTDVLITTNTAEPPGVELTEGGGVYASGTALVFDGETTVTLNLAVLGGGLALHDGASLTGGLVLTNVGFVQGGGIYAVTGAAPITLDGVTLQTNHAAGSGGGLQVAGGVVLGNSLLLDSNDGGAAGGGVAVGPSSDVTLTGGQVFANIAENGGAGSMLGVGAEASSLATVGVDFGTDLTANLPRSLQVGADTVPVEGSVTMSCVSDRGCQ